MVLTMQLGRSDIIVVKVEFQTNNTQLVHSTGVNMLVMALQGCKSTHQKTTPLESGLRKHGVWIAIMYSVAISWAKNMN